MKDKQTLRLEFRYWHVSLPYVWACMLLLRIDLKFLGSLLVFNDFLEGK